MDIYTLLTVSLKKIAPSLITNVGKFILDKIISNKNKLNNGIVSIFKQTYDNTLKIFCDERLSPYPISEDDYNKLSSIDEIKLGIIFHKVEYIEMFEKDNNAFFLLSQDFKEYNKSINIQLEDIFYLFWQEKFREEYNKVLIRYLCSDNEFKQTLLVDTIGLAFNSFDTIIQNQLYIKQDLKEIKQDTSLLPSIYNDVKVLKEISLKFQEIMISDDEELKKIKEVFDRKEYSECKTYIELNKEDRWKNKSYEFKATIYNMLGNCYFNLYDFTNSKLAYNMSLEYNNQIDQPKYNLANIAIIEKNEKDFLDSINKFCDKKSKIYNQIYFTYLCELKKDYDQAEKFLEENKSTFSNYLFLKAILLMDKLSIDENSSEVEELLKKYIQNEKDETNKTVAQYNLYNHKFVKLLNNLSINIQYIINFDGTLETLPNKSLQNNTELEDLLNDFIELNQNVERYVPQNKDIILNIFVKISILEYVLGKKTLGNINIDKINNDCIQYFNNNQSNIELLLLNIICKNYVEAEKLFQFLDEESSEANIIIKVIILFGLQKFSNILEILNDTNKDNTILEQIKLISLFKVKGWASTLKYIQEQDYDNEKLLLSADFAIYNNSYDYAAEKYNILANNIILNEIEYNIHFVQLVIFGLGNFTGNIKLIDLRNKLIKYSWEKNSSEDNFAIGILYASNLYNSGKYSECLDVIEILHKYRPDDINVKNIYAQIDLINYNPKTLIKNYENGFKSEQLFPTVAYSYLQVDQLKKAEKIINILQHKKEYKLNYYYLAIELSIKRKKYDKFIELSELAIKEYPEDLNLCHLIFNKLLNIKFANDKTRQIFSHCRNILVEKKECIEFQIDTKNDTFEQIQKAIDSFQPYSSYKDKEKIIKNSFKEYNKHHLPLLGLAQILCIPELSLISNLITDKDRILYSSYDSYENVEEKCKLLKKNSNIIVSSSTLILFKVLGIDSIVFEHFKIKISAKTKNEIDKIISCEQSEIIPKLIRDKNGKSLIINFKNEIYPYIDYLENCRKKLKIVNYNSDSNKAKEIIKATEQIPIKDLFYNSIVAKQHNYLLSSSDLILQIVNDKCFHISDISILSILHYMNQNKMISDTDYMKIKYMLISMNYRYIYFTNTDLSYFSELDKEGIYNTLQYIDRHYSKDSLADVFALFVYNNQNNVHIYEYINEIFQRFKILDYTNELIYLFMLNISERYFELNNYIQKCLSYQFSQCNLTISDLISYYTNLINHISKIDFSNKKINIYEINRLVDNSPKEITESLKLYLKK